MDGVRVPFSCIKVPCVRFEGLEGSPWLLVLSVLKNDMWPIRGCFLTYGGPFSGCPRNKSHTGWGLC